MTRRIPRRTRDALFIGADTLRVNCGRCGKELLVRLEDIRAERTIDCEECAKGATASESARLCRRLNRAAIQFTVVQPTPARHCAIVDVQTSNFVTGWISQSLERFTGRTGCSPGNRCE